MFNLFFALFLAFACPAHNHTNCHNNTVITQDVPPPDSGGDDGHIHP